MEGHPRERVLTVGAGRLHVRDIGDDAGRPIVVLHGGPDFDYEYLLPEIDRLADLGRLVVYAQRGRGRSYNGEGADAVSIDSDVADLDAIRDWTGGERVVLIGHSWGTVLAMEYATRHPDRVSHLGLVSSAPASHADAVALRSHLRTLRTPEQRERMAELWTDQAFLAGDVQAEAEYYRMHFARALHEPEDVDVIVGRLRRTFTPEAIVAARAIEDRLYEQTWDVESYDLLGRLASLGAPTLVLRGDHDFIPTAVSEHIAAAIPGSRFVPLEGGGHFPFMERPAAVHAAIAELLAH
ncbi:MAG TPA: alpha/beta fold hydrolase [Candidatus Limnocylindria bacterium]|nr:alpha/beta fold hydrolase [Candidatus Limnocylindria bacterium]